jgi:NADH:ubiquinone oxidoreductase subunit D
MDGANSEAGTNNWLHSRAFEKLRKTVLLPNYTITDRMNYCSSPINNMGWWMTLEKLLILKFQKSSIFKSYCDGQELQIISSVIQSWCNASLYWFLICVSI